MVSIESNNEPISIQLAADEFVTVPSGEVWQVNITGPDAIVTDTSSTTALSIREVMIDGLRPAGSCGGFRRTSWLTGMNHTTIFPLEDVILVGGSEIGAYQTSVNVSGFVIQKE